ncbi:MAG: hypothetical protein AB7S26_38060 [Sandaracinaceae bacterium]
MVWIWLRRGLGCCSSRARIGCSSRFIALGWAFLLACAVSVQTPSASVAQSDPRALMWWRIRVAEISLPPSPDAESGPPPNPSWEHRPIGPEETVERIGMLECRASVVELVTNHYGATRRTEHHYWQRLTRAHRRYPRIAFETG